MHSGNKGRVKGSSREKYYTLGAIQDAREQKLIFVDYKSRGMEGSAQEDRHQMTMLKTDLEKK